MLPKIIFSSLLLIVFWGTPVIAYQAIDAEPTAPLEPIEITIGDSEVYYLGNLQQFPDVFEFTLTKSETLDIALRGLPKTDTQFSGILVQKQEGVFVELRRLVASESEWLVKRDKLTGSKYRDGGSFSITLEPGTYRFEVANENNEGKYLLVIAGLEKVDRYGETLAAIKAVNQFYGNSSLGMLRAPLVRYTLGIPLVLILLSGTIYLTRRRR